MTLDTFRPSDLTFDEDQHTYWLGPVRVPHVTEVLEPLQDFEHIPAFVLQRKTALGSAVHRACELYDHDDLDEMRLDPAIVGYLEAWKHYRWEQGPFREELIETRLLSCDPLYAGTADRIDTDRSGKRRITDIKTTARLHAVVPIQLAAYAKAARATIRRAVHLKPDGEYVAVDYPPAELGRDFELFEACLAIHTWKETHR